MKLSEMYKERMAAIPELTRLKLVDAVGSAAVYAIQHDVPRKFRKSTLHKIAELWKCSVGDIQACMAEMPNPLRKEAEKQEGKIFIGDKPKSKHDEVAKMMRQRPFTPDEEPAEVFKPEVEVFETHMQTVEEYKQELRNLFVKIASGIKYSDDKMIVLTSAFGKAVLDQIAEKGESDE